MLDGLTHPSCLLESISLSPSQAASLFYVSLCAGMAVLSFLRVKSDDPTNFHYTQYAEAAFLVMLTVTPGRMARQMARTSKSALEGRRAFVQYISHEARGPLSVASMGLEMHLGELRRAIAEADKQGSGSGSGSVDEETGDKEKNGNSRGNPAKLPPSTCASPLRSLGTDHSP